MENERRKNKVVTYRDRVKDLPETKKIYERLHESQSQYDNIKDEFCRHSGYAKFEVHDEYFEVHGKIYGNSIDRIMHYDSDEDIRYLAEDIAVACYKYGIYGEDRGEILLDDDELLAAFMIFRKQEDVNFVEEYIGNFLDADIEAENKLISNSEFIADVADNFRDSLESLSLGYQILGEAIEKTIKDYIDSGILKEE